METKAAPQEGFGKRFGMRGTKPAAAPIDPDAKVEFESIYQQANVAAVAFTSEQTLDMIDALPSELPLETRRQTIKVTLGAMGKAIGANPETICADASRKLAALGAYSERVMHKTSDFVKEAEDEISSLTEQIEEKRQAIELAKQRKANAISVCSAESERLSRLIEFFNQNQPAPQPQALEN